MKFVLKSLTLVLTWLLLATSAFSATHTVSMVNFRFNPATLNINVGDTVTWVDTQGNHDTVSGSGGRPDGVWNSNTQYPRLMSPGQSFSFTFTSAGTYPYFCTPHFIVGMVGTITVAAGNVPPTVSIVRPADGSDFAAPASITVEASAFDSDGGVTQVEFFRNGTSFGVVTTPPYTVSANDLAPGAYTFTATATDTGGATASASVSITVSGQQPTITSPPQSRIAVIGSDVTFDVQATGSAPLSYQWLFGSTPIPNATGPSLLLTNVSSSDAGVYTVQVANTFGSASASATLTVTNVGGTPPTIVTQPESQTVDPGMNVTFTATATGFEPLDWQWFFNGAPIVGQTNSSLALANVTTANAGAYHALVNNPYGSATTSVATLTVKCDFALSTNRASFPARGGTNRVTVTGSPACTWTILNTNFWIQAIPASGTGSVTIALVAFPNAAGIDRTGVLLIAGIPFTITQASTLVRGDFNRDGHTDFLWQNLDGRVRLWLMDGATNIGSLLLRAPQNVPPGSQIVGTHDFNRDRNEDILWQHPNGALEIWFMNRTNFVRAEPVADAPRIGRLWHVVGLGDLDNDTQTDILLRDPNGRLLVWFMKGKHFLRQTLINRGEPVSTAWRIVGVADFDHDLQADIIWQGPDSSLVLWLMQSGLPRERPALSNLPRIDARIIGLNDLNQDGSLDFIWRHGDNHLSVWSMSQTNLTNSIRINQSISPSWKLVAPKR